MAIYLKHILEYHRQRAADDKRPFEELLAEAKSESSSSRGFAEALAQAKLRGEVGIIAEIKRRSPSKGDLRPNLDPAQIADSYQAGGATCLSVLTDQQFFSGSASDLMKARKNCSLPVLRKDFTVAASDICDARIMGADAVLLIVSALDTKELKDFLDLTEYLGMDALVETHSAFEIGLAYRAGATLVGINQRDLNTFEVDRKLAASLYPHLLPRSINVAESAIRGPKDARKLFKIGFDGVLVGESFITSPDPGAAVEDFIAELG